MKIELAFAEVLKEVRRESGISQDQLARMANLDRTFISLLERGLRQPSLKSIFQIASALNLEPDTLVTKIKELIYENTKN
jgi:transcriptional regulator with XRE-family HTH domain